MIDKFTARFLKGLESKARQADVSPFFGKRECKELSVPTPKALLSNSIRQGFSSVKQREAEERQQRILAVAVIATHQKYSTLYLHPQNEDLFRRHARDLGNLIYDLPVIRTGLRSRRSIETGEKVPEHFYPRQWAGSVIVDFIFAQKGITEDQLLKFFNVFRQVHIVTKEENMLLKPFQNANYFEDWHIAYQRAGIELVAERPTTYQPLSDVLHTLVTFN